MPVESVVPPIAAPSADPSAPIVTRGDDMDILAELTRVGVALSTERNLLTLLEMILSQARRISGSDAGSLYLVERNDKGAATALRFKLSQNSSLPDLALREFTVPIDPTSLSGYAASTGQPLIISDVYLLPSDVAYRQNRSFDDRFGYRTKSMLVIPMKTHRDEVIGVLQLINRKADPNVRLTSVAVTERAVLSYDQRSVDLVTALASQAAVAIENSTLYEDIERLFEGFVTAAVTAIEVRDPTTYGHSGRVAAMSVALAEAVDRGAGHGAHRGVRFTREQLRELRYAGLLHDFGKVGVREQVLVKEKKLYPFNLDTIRLRFAGLLREAEVAFERARAEHLLAHGRTGYEERVQELEQLLRAERARLDRDYEAIVAANEPTLLDAGSFEQLARLAERTVGDLDGSRHPLLTSTELGWLRIRRGNLDDTERREIESHVMHTYRFLQQIPWTRELRDVPEIAFRHHEKLNGSGYPLAVGAERISVQTRIMTIADIYDALTAADRPYKRAVPRDRALEILHQEAADGQLDADLVRTFVEAKVYEQFPAVSA
jgi:HD-GYP domain-containing protein (c-di-GMP phosphodiesterase class II)